MHCSAIPRVFLIIFLANLLINNALGYDPSRHPKAVSTPSPDAALQAAYEHFYNLDYDRCIPEFEIAAQTHPDDPAFMNHVIQAEIFRELYRLNLLDTTLYAREGQGFLSGTKPENADPKVREKIMQLADHATALEEDRLKANPNDIKALFDRGETRGYRATYFALIDKNFMGSLRMALAARSDHEHVLRLAPDFLDAKLIVGTDEFVVGSLPLAVRIMAGMAGITGNKKKGLQYLQDVADHSRSESVDARIALALFLRRQARYDDALAVVRSLVKDCPRNFLFSLEEANLLKDAGKGAEAIAAYSSVLEKARTGFFPQPHVELARFGLADTQRGQKRYQEALENYQAVQDSTQCSRELRQRASLSAGQVFDILGLHDLAKEHYQTTIAFDTSSAQAESARKLLRSPYKGS